MNSSASFLFRVSISVIAGGAILIGSALLTSNSRLFADEIKEDVPTMECQARLGRTSIKKKDDTEYSDFRTYKLPKIPIGSLGSVKVSDTFKFEGGYQVYIKLQRLFRGSEFLKDKDVIELTSIFWKENEDKSRKVLGVNSTHSGIIEDTKKLEIARDPKKQYVETSIENLDLWNIKVNYPGAISNYEMVTQKLIPDYSPTIAIVDCTMLNDQ